MTRITPTSREFRLATAGYPLALLPLALLTLALVPGVPARAAAVPAPAGAHEVPASVTVHAFVKPDGELLRLIVRVPLESLRDIEFPLRGADLLDVVAMGPLLPDAAQLWIADYIALYEDDVALGGGRVAAARISLPSDPSFQSYDAALAHVRGPPLPAGTELYWQHALVDMLLEYPIASEHARFAIEPALAHLGLRTTTVLRFLPPGGTERALQYGGNPGLVRLDPRWHQAAFSFVRLGFLHILGGTDHILFLLCLAIPLRRILPLVGIVLAFTVAHSITLIAAALGHAPNTLWFPPFIELLIALSIVYMACENILGARVQRRWVLAFGFGLVHGFGFSFFLRESLQFAGAHLATSLFAFNVGVELGQLAVLAVLVPALAVLFRHVPSPRALTILLSALIAHSAWHWLTERAVTLRAYSFEWPALDVAFAASALRWLMALLVLGGAVWLLADLLRRDPLAARPSTDHIGPDPHDQPGPAR